jgi:radical SAM protein with 4Fe4S-binding SPASM domain
VAQTQIETATYGDFSTLLHERFEGRRVPVEVSIEVTHRCPLQCQHCYNNLPMSDANARREELTFEEHLKLLDELADAGCLWLLYTGGEIFARKDFLEIYTEAKKRGFLITLFTNGTMITPRIADYLAEYRPFNVEITLYGATRKTYETLTQIPGSFDRCMRGIQLLLERGLPLKLKTVPTSINFHEVYEMKRFAEQDCGVEFKFDPMVNPRTDCSQSPLAVRLTPEQAVSLEFRDPVRKAEYARLANDEIAAHLPTSTKKYTCGGGHNGCAIDPKGKMTICVLSHRDGYELRSGSFEQGWNGRMKQIRATETTRETICTRCQIRSLCSMCAANGELENGDAESPVDFLCQVAHLRAFALGIEVPEHGADCACCEGGRQHAALREMAERIDRNTPAPANLIPLSTSNSLLPVLNASGGCSTGGCSTCGTHSH